LPRWLTASSTSGTATESAKTISIKINSNADKLSPGSYFSSINLDNTSNAKGPRAPWRR
jgi:hypothetical protein